MDRKVKQVLSRGWYQWRKLIPLLKRVKEGEYGENIL
jgi:hypothetical protein